MQKHTEKTKNISMAEGTGISVLLNRSSSLKGPLVLGRTINSSAISYVDLSYARYLTSSMRSSISHGSISTTSSIDLTSARHGEIVCHRQMSSKRSDASSKPQSTRSSFSGTFNSLQVYQGFGLSISSRDENCEGSVSNVRHISGGELPGSPSDHMELHEAVTCVSSSAMGGEENNVICSNSREKDKFFMENSIVSSDFEDKAQTPMGPDAAHIVHKLEEDLPKSVGNIQILEEMTFIESSMAEENTMQDNRVCQGGAAEDHVQCSTSTMSEIEINDSHLSSLKSPIDVVSREEFEDTSSTTYYDEDGKHSSFRSIETSHADVIEEEFIVTVEEQEGRRTRIMTLEEATDAILFCSSLIHDLAYKAANIAIDKEKENLEPLKGSRPMVTIPERRSSERRDPIPHGVTSGKSSKTNKTRKRRATTDMDVKPPLTENEERSNEPVFRNAGLPNHGNSMKPPKLESKCNCTIM